MILYLDTSALAKLYANEPGSGLVRGAVQNAQLTVCHLIAYVETRAAFAKKRRMGEFSEKEFSLCKSELERTWQRFERMSVDETLVQQAGNLADRFGLRGCDSVHLAAAETLFRVAGPAVEFRFAVFDDNLRKAAIDLGMMPLEE